MMRESIIREDTKGVQPMLGRELTGCVLVLHPECLSVPFRTPQHQLWRATGGFGCFPHAAGRAVFATALADDEKTRWYRSDFIGIASDELVRSVMDGGEQ